jgi:hypothetical protein
MSNFSRLRINLLLSFASILTYPSITIAIFSYYLYLYIGLAIPGYVKLALIALSVPIQVIVRGLYRDWRSQRRAHQLGAILIPQVIGQWPGNIDIYIRIVKSRRQGYISQVAEDLYRQYGCTTLNLRLLWEDTIISCDNEHIRHALVTKFDAYDKGELQKQRK